MTGNNVTFLFIYLVFFFFLWKHINNQTRCKMTSMFQSQMNFRHICYFHFHLKEKKNEKLFIINFCVLFVFIPVRFLFLGLLLLWKYYLQFSVHSCSNVARSHSYLYRAAFHSFDIFRKFCKMKMNYNSWQIRHTNWAYILLRFDFSFSLCFFFFIKLHIVYYVIRPIFNAIMWWQS